MCQESPFRATLQKYNILVSQITYFIENSLTILSQRTKNLTINVVNMRGQYDYSVYILQQQNNL